MNRNGRASLTHLRLPHHHSLCIHVLTICAHHFPSYTSIVAPTPGKERSNDDAGLIAGVVIGITIAIAAIVTITIVISVYFVITKRKEQKKRQAL